MQCNILHVEVHHYIDNCDVDDDNGKEGYVSIGAICMCNLTVCMPIFVNTFKTFIFTFNNLLY